VNGAEESVDTDLYQTDDQKETLEALSSTGTVSWKKTVADLFGSGVDLNEGWDFTSYGPTEVATVASSSQSLSVDVDDAKTIGFSVATGSPTWSLGGMFQCGGSLGFEDPPFSCVATGKLLHPNQKSEEFSFKGISLSLQGFDPSTGAKTWTVSVRNVDELENGNAAYLDATHLVVQLHDGSMAMLDTSTGTTAPVTPKTAVWCTTIESSYKIDENGKLNPGREITGTPAYFACNPTGKATSSLPSTRPQSVGVNVDGDFVWVSPKGLSRVVSGSATGVA
jgi:hypothetical protein